MQDCGSLVETIYTSPELTRLISKIKPQAIQDDLRQEVALSLLEQPCDRLQILYSEDALLKYTLKTCWIMATSKTSAFYYRHKKNDLLKAVEYMRALTTGTDIPITFAHTAKIVIDSKNKDVHDDHEARIFNKFVELGSGRKVAEYYNIPVQHVCKIIKKVKLELKCILQS